MTDREQLYFTAKRFCRAAEDSLEHRTRAQGLTASQGFLLLYISQEHPGGVTLTDLHRELGLAKGTLSGYIKILRDKGYLEVEICPEDERQKTLFPTRKLWTLQPELERAVQSTDELLSREMPLQEQRKLSQLLEQAVPGVETKESERKDVS